jgi:hypothetical protein
MGQGIRWLAIPSFKRYRSSRHWLAVELLVISVSPTIPLKHNVSLGSVPPVFWSIRFCELCALRIILVDSEWKSAKTYICCSYDYSSQVN